MSLGEIGAKAAAAIPFLSGLLDDNDLVFAKYVKDLGYEVTTPGKEAALALAKIGNAKLAVESLITALEHKDKIVRMNASNGLKEITGQRILAMTLLDGRSGGTKIGTTFLNADNKWLHRIADKSGSR